MGIVDDDLVDFIDESWCCSELIDFPVQITFFSLVGMMTARDPTADPNIYFMEFSEYLPAISQRGI